MAPSFTQRIGQKHGCICVPVCEKTIQDFRAAIDEAVRIGDAIEIRLDCLERAERRNALRDLNQLLSRISKPVIITSRAGDSSLSDAIDSEEWRLVRNMLTNTCLREDQFFDIELSAARRLKSEAIGLEIDWDRIITSYHDFESPPEDLNDIYEELLQTSALVKLAVKANDVTDCLPVFKILAQAKDRNREVIAIAMGEAGVATRILGPARGSFLTFGALNQNRATAPGQPNAQDLRELYRIHEITDKTPIYGIIGSPVVHSFSPRIFNSAFAAAAIDAVYIPFEVRDLHAFFTRMVRERSLEIDWPVRGFSVTAPHKVSVMAELDWIDAEAQQIGAINTVVSENDRLLGYNTDAHAALAPLKGVIELKEASVGVIGSGGAARALVSSLKRAGAQVTVFSLNVNTAVHLADKFAVDVMPLRDAKFGGCDLVVNATPLGTKGELERETPATTEQLQGVQVVYDLVYNPAETLLLQQARAAGCKTINGIEI